MRDTEKLSSLFTTSVHVASVLRSTPAPSAEPPKTNDGEPAILSSLLRSAYAVTPLRTFLMSGGVTEVVLIDAGANPDGDVVLSFEQLAMTARPAAASDVNES